MTSATASNRVAKAYASFGGKEAFPWEQILAILMQLLGGMCPTPADSKAFAKAHPLAAEFLAKRNMLREGYSNKEAGLLAKAAVKALNATSVADLEDLMT